MKTIEKIKTRFEDTMSAVAFAEAGEFETARMIMNRGEGPQNRIQKRLEKTERPRVATRRAAK